VEKQNLRSLLEKPIKYAAVARELTGLSDSVFDATNRNGDSVKNEWVEQANVSLRVEAEKVVDDLNDIIAQVLLDKHVSEFVKDEQLTQSESAALMRRLKSIGFTKLMVRYLRDNVDVIVDRLVNLSNNVFVAASTRLVEGLNQQLKEDDELSALQIEFEPEILTEKDLLIVGQPLKFHIELLFADVFSESWFITNVTQALSTSTSLPATIELLKARNVTRVVTLASRLKRAAFNVASDAVNRANQQLAEINVNVRD